MLTRACKLVCQPSRITDLLLTTKIELTIFFFKQMITHCNNSKTKETRGITVVLANYLFLRLVFRQYLKRG